MAYPMFVSIKVRELYKLIIVLAIVVTPGCSSLIRMVYGVKRPNSVSIESMLKFSKKYNVPLANSYYVDSSFLSFIVSFGDDELAKKNHYQPLQALYFDRDSNLLSYHVNCYAGGFPNLKWDRDSTFECFPPKQQAPLDTIFTLRRIKRFFIPIHLQDEPSNTESHDYTVIIFWNRMMGRQSKRFIELVQENALLVQNSKTVQMLYVNNDLIFE